MGISNKRQIRAGLRDQIILKKTTCERHHTVAPPILITTPWLQNRSALRGQIKPVHPCGKFSDERLSNQSVLSECACLA